MLPDEWKWMKMEMVRGARASDSRKIEMIFETNWSVIHMWFLIGDWDGVCMYVASCIIIICLELHM